MAGAEPFLLPGGEQGVLLVHGFTGSPSEMRLLGEYLNGQGYTVLAPRLAGHGTRVEEMITTGWPMWYENVEDAYHLLSGLCPDITAVGLSMGGLLAFKLGAEYPVNRVVALSTPIYILHKRLWLLPVYRLFRKYIVKKRRQYRNVEPRYSVYYNRMPLPSLSSLLALIKEVDVGLPAFDKPALVVQSRVEHTVRPDSAQYIYDRIGSRYKELLWLNNSGHIITIDGERDKVFRAIAEFLKEDY